MIEFTQEQWQGITQQENPTVIEPQTKKTYVVIPKDEYEKMQTISRSEAEVAYVLRLVWTRRMRLDEDEIIESLRDDPPANIQQEMKQIKALDHLDKVTPPGEVLRKFAVEY